MKSGSSNADKLKTLGHVLLNRNMKDKAGVQFKGISIREIRATLIMFLAIFLFLAMWIPSVTSYVMTKLCPEKSSLTMILAHLLLYQLNSMVNPLLFARSIKDTNEILSRWTSSMTSSFIKSKSSQSQSQSDKKTET